MRVAGSNGSSRESVSMNMGSTKVNEAGGEGRTTWNEFCDFFFFWKHAEVLRRLKGGSGREGVKQSGMAVRDCCWRSVDFEWLQGISSHPHVSIIIRGAHRCRE